MRPIYTVGHSNRSIEDFLALLKNHGIQTVADIRSFPRSKKFPYFDGENLRTVLPQHGIQYVWLPKLGGRRSARKGFQSPNSGLTSPGFRNYADYMSDDGFRDGVKELLEIAENSLTAFMCAEAVFWRCHRNLLSDHLVAHGVEVFHIMGMKNPVRHTLTQTAAVTSEGEVIYPGV